MLLIPLEEIALTNL